MRSTSRRVALGLFASLFLTAHTPYGQWIAYRQKHLLIGAHRKDPEGYTLAKQLAEHLALHLPDARARVARAPAPSRLASLLATDQLDVALLDAATIQAMRDAAGVFKAFGPIDLHLLSQFEQFTLTVRGDFSASHAWLLASAFSDISSGSDPTAIPIHPGAQAFRQGKPKPAA